MFNQPNRPEIAIILFITLLLSTTFVFSEENETQQNEYYDLGLIVAEQDYKGVAEHSLIKAYLTSSVSVSNPPALTAVPVEGCIAEQEACFRPGQVRSPVKKE